jgi:hypothetical protein
VHPGDWVTVRLNGHKDPVLALVVGESEEDFIVEYESDRVKEVYERSSDEILTSKRGIEQPSMAGKRELDESRQEQIEWKNEILSGTKRKRNGQPINPPQPPRDELPNPSESPDEFDHIIIEVGSGSGTFALAVYHTGKGKVGVYTIDWDDDRFAHLKQDLRFLNFHSLLKIFPNLRHVHFTWDCKSNSPAGSQPAAQCPFGAKATQNMRIVGPTAPRQSPRASRTRRSAPCTSRRPAPSQCKNT